jgi:methylphosphotriester-DNA--protein-cysteine methyltransferase
LLLGSTRISAKAAGASLFHFCKVCRKTTGLKFTDYVARIRLEDAKTQPLNPIRSNLARFDRQNWMTTEKPIWSSPNI